MLVGLVEQVSVDLGASSYVATDWTHRFTPMSADQSGAEVCRLGVYLALSDGEEFCRSAAAN
jgi:hypothetical protein